jgi:hypothetical protein
MTRTQTIFPRPWGNDESITLGDGNCPMCGCDLKPGEAIYLDGMCRVCFLFRCDNANPDLRLGYDRPL